MTLQDISRATPAKNMSRRVRTVRQRDALTRISANTSLRHPNSGRMSGRSQKPFSPIRTRKTSSTASVATVAAPAAATAASASAELSLLLLQYEAVTVAATAAATAAEEVAQHGGLTLLWQMIMRSYQLWREPKCTASEWICDNTQRR